MMRGATPAAAMPSDARAMGVSPWRFAAASLAMSNAAAPSLNPEALPAVTVPSGADDRLKFCQCFRGRVGAGMLVLCRPSRLAPSVAGWRQA